MSHKKDLNCAVYIYLFVSSSFVVLEKVDYSGDFEVGNPQRFGQEFQGRIANPKDVVSLHRRKAAPRK